MAVVVLMRPDHTNHMMSRGFGRDGEPGVLEWPWGTVLGARWPFLIPAQRRIVKDQEVRTAKPPLASRFRSQLRARFTRN